MLFYINHVECTEYFRCHHKLSSMNNNHILDITQMMANISNQLILCGLSMMTPWHSLIMGSFPRTSLTVHTVCYLAQTLNKRKCAIKLKSLFPIWLNCRFGSSVCYFYSRTAEGFLRTWTFCEGQKIGQKGEFLKFFYLTKFSDYG